MATYSPAHSHVNRPLVPFRFLIVAVLAVVVVGTVFAILSLSDDEGTGDQLRATLTEADEGQVITVQPNAEIIIRLGSNATTGHQWTIADLDEAILVYLGTSYEPAQDGLIGQGGVQELRFRAAKKGESVLALKYWQPWEGDASVADRFEVQVTVASDD